MVVWPICVKIGAGVGQGSLGANEIYQNIKDVYGSDLFRFRESKIVVRMARLAFFRLKCCMAK